MLFKQPQHSSAAATKGWLLFSAAAFLDQKAYTNPR